MEHHANIVPWQLLAQQVGATIKVAPINEAGELILDSFATLLNHRTKLVAVTHVSNALGTVNPVEQLIALAHSYGVPVLVDGAQSTPHMPFAISSCFPGTRFWSDWHRRPLRQGGGNMIQDVTFTKTTYQGIPQKFEAGTQDIAGVVGLSAAIDYLTRLGMPAIAAYEHELLEYATQALASVGGLRPIGTATHKASVLSFVLDGFENEDVSRHLDQQGIAVRSGHHCAQPTVRRYGYNGTVRPSLAFYNTHDEIDALVRALHQLKPEIAERTARSWTGTQSNHWRKHRRPGISTRSWQNYGTRVKSNIMCDIKGASGNCRPVEHCWKCWMECAPSCSPVITADRT